MPHCHCSHPDSEKSINASSYVKHETSDTFKKNKAINAIYINTLGPTYGTCDLLKVDDKKVQTYYNVSDLPEKTDDCVLYCAHSKCNSANNYYAKHEQALHDRCGNVHYIESGAKEMMNNPRFEMKDAAECKADLRL
tara:strand:+ start:215 stop:625 length:411 start_codon:yes stop_codon:yes gene_type:complete